MNDSFQEIRSALEGKLDALERRMGKIQSDRRRDQGPLDPDSEERAVELENVPVLDALDAAGRAELDAIRAALQRLDENRFGTCGACGEPIAFERLRAVPTATTCRSCTD